jgi:hypothetical protein
MSKILATPTERFNLSGNIRGEYNSTNVQSSFGGVSRLASGRGGGAPPPRPSRSGPDANLETGSKGTRP